MAVVMISTAPTRELYDQVTKAMMAAHGDAPVPGLIAHTASEAGGAVKIIDVWESREAADAFGEQLRPHIEAAMGGPVPAGPPPDAELYDVFDLLVPQRS